MTSFGSNPHEYTVNALEWIKVVRTVEIQKDQNLEASHFVHD
jgi:hypothetical protein